MIKVYIISGFLGSGKTTLIKKIINSNEFGKMMIIENEFGEIGIDGNLFDTKLNIKEINSGCICCDLKGDLKEALEEIKQMDIDSLIIEPSGVGKLSDIITNIINDDKFELVSHMCMVDANKALIYHKNYKEIFDDQIIAANAVVLSRVELIDDVKLNNVVEMIKQLNDEIKIITTPYLELKEDYLMDIIKENVCDCPECVGCFEEEVSIMNDHHECEMEHHHYHHHGHSDHDTKECHHHHHHDAKELFTNIGIETVKIFTKEELENILSQLKKEEILRAKGFVRSYGTWLYFNLAGEDIEITEGEAKYTGLVSAIASKLDKEELERLFK